MVFVSHREHGEHQLQDDETFLCCGCSAVLDIGRLARLTGYTAGRVFYRMECPSCRVDYRVLVEQ